MNLAEALNAQPPAAHGPTCSVGLLLAELDEPDRAALNAAMSNQRKPAKWIHQQIVGAGHSVAASAIGRHRITPTHARECACRD